MKDNKKDKKEKEKKEVNDKTVVAEETVESANQEVDLLGNRIKSLEETLLRNQAELQNYKRRKEEEVAKMLKYANEDIILDFLPILDNLERAFKTCGENDDDKFLAGIKMVYSQIQILLTKFEVKEIVSENAMFDAKYHEAIMTGCDTNKQDGTILEVLQKGYIYKDKVIRVAMVKVNKIEK